jgi:CRISPR-associated protein Cmr2
MPKNYLSLTIGPIYETISYCQKTRELWAGSYFFSYFMKLLIASLEEEEDIEFIIPHIDNNVLNNDFKVGMFHDRFIATSSQSKEILKQLLENRVAETIYFMAQLIGDDDSKLSNETRTKELLKNTKIDTKTKAYTSLQNYIQYNYIVATESELLNATKAPNVIFAIDTILDSLELQNSFDFYNSAKVFQVKRDDYKKTLKDKVSAVAKLQYQAKELKNRIGQQQLKFRSIPEIALANVLANTNDIDNAIEKEINQKINHGSSKFEWCQFIDDNYDIERYEEVYNTLDTLAKKDETIKQNYKPYHKYYAVISADGDKIGQTIRNIYNENPEEITTLSKNLYTYIAKEELPLVKLFDDFGGMLIYAGGDDLLGFVPIFGKHMIEGENRNKHIFDLLEELSTRFKQIVGENVSLSFGVSINYYKSPMIEAIKASYTLLQEAKENNTEQKSGSLALCLTKHGGQQHKGIFFMHDTIYTAYKTLFIGELTGTIELPHNLHYKLQMYETLFVDIFTTYKKESSTKLNALFTNLITDESHSKTAKEALKSTQTYIENFVPNTPDRFKLLLAQLAIIKFLRGDS